MVAATWFTHVNSKTSLSVPGFTSSLVRIMIFYNRWSCS